MVDGVSINEIIWLLVLAVYVFIVGFFTKNVYDYFIKKGVKKDVAVYYNRKFVHIFAGGVAAVLVPLVFPNPWYPLFCGLGITFFTFVAHRTGHIMYWFQNENFNDVSFCLMWSLSIFVLWYVTNDPWISVIPAAFMSFGDGMTGVVRNKLFKKRNKHPVGNFVMILVCVPIGFYFAGHGVSSIAYWGVLAGVVASIVEKFEYKFIDDNVFITLSSAIILYLGTIF